MAFDEDRQKVKLSLRQADILRDLAEDSVLKEQGGCVPHLQAVQQYVCLCSEVEMEEANLLKSWRFYTSLPPRVWPLHARGNSRQTLGNWFQGPSRCGAKYEMAVSPCHSLCFASVKTDTLKEE